jgi:hypothetical protein
MITDYHLQHEKALSSTVGKPRNHDYSVTFEDAQDLERIRQKLLKANLILKLNIKAANSWLSGLTRLSKRIGEPHMDHCQIVVQQYVASLETHSAVVESLLQRLDGINRLVSFNNWDEINLLLRLTTDLTYLRLQEHGAKYTH